MSNRRKETALLQAALDLFTEKGFHGTTTAEIARRAGVSTGILFYYFSSKEVLIHRLYAHLKNQMHAAIERLDYTRPLREILQTLWHNSVRWAMEHRREFHFIKQYTLSPYAGSPGEPGTEVEFKNLDQILARGELQLSEQQLPVLVESFKSSIQGAVAYLLKNRKKTGDSLFFNLWWEGFQKCFRDSPAVPEEEV